MDPDLEPHESLQQQMEDLSCWLRNPNPHKHLTLLLYELVEHLAFTGDAFWYVLRDGTGKPLEIWPMRAALPDRGRSLQTRGSLRLRHARSPHRRNYSL